MECKFCNALLEENETLCPVCGRNQTEEPVKKRSLAWVWAVLGALVVTAAAVLVILLAVNARKPVPNVALAEDRSYSLGNHLMTPGISSKIVASSEKRTVITELKALLGVDPLKEGLTNAELSILYWDTFIGFYQNYSYYIAYFGLDITAMDKSLFNDGQNWQEYFLTQAINRYRMQKALCEEARNTGFVLPEELQKQLDETIAGLSEEADIQQQLEDIYGPNVTLDMYIDYLREQHLYSAYVDELTEQVEYTDAEIEAYYDANAEYYEQNNVKKVDKNVVTIRHALIEPADKTVEDDWAAARARAESLYNEWLAGDKSEESFAELAKANSSDGNAAEGGIYENVYPGMMVAAFNDWCFDDARQVGDHGIVETEFGYHIMYFSGVGDYVYWREAARNDYVNEKVNDQAVALAESYTLYVDRDRIALALPGQFLTED